MGKRQLVLYGDDDLIAIAKAKDWNLSELFNNMLQSMINSDSEPKKTREEIDKEILNHQIEINRLNANKIEQEKKKGLTFEYEP